MHQRDKTLVFENSGKSAKIIFKKGLLKLGRADTIKPRHLNTPLNVDDLEYEDDLRNDDKKINQDNLKD